MQHRHVLRGERKIAERKARGQHGVFDRLRARTRDAAAVEPRADAVHAREELFAAGVVDHADDRRVFGQRFVGGHRGAGMRDQGDRHGVMRDVVQEVGGAVERVDVPGGHTLGLAARFLGDDAELGGAGLQFLDDRGLRLAVRLGHEVVAGLAIDHEIGAMVRVGLQDGCASMSCRDGRVDRGAQVDGRCQRLGLIVGIHWPSVSPPMRQTCSKRTNPFAAWCASNANGHVAG